MKRPGTPTYPKTRGPWELEPHYSHHVGAMTSEGLHAKADIAFQLALRDERIAELEAELEMVGREMTRVMAERDAAVAQGAPQHPDLDPGVNWDRGNLGH